MTVDQLLRDANPVPAVQPLSTRERNLMLHTIHERINADTLTSRKPLRGGRRFFLVPATWLAGVAVAGVVGMAVLAPADTPMAPAANAAELLNQAATNVPISTSQSALSSSPYIKVHKVGQVLASTGPTGWMVSTDRTEYVPLADTERTWIVEATANQVTQVYGSGTANKPRPETYVWATRPAGANEPGWARPNQAFLATLPLDPQLLRDRLYEHVAGHGFSDDAASFTAISDLLKSGYAGDDTRACLYRVLGAGAAPSQRTAPARARTARQASDSRACMPGPSGYLPRFIRTHSRDAET
ncbi:MAG: hypothetical protein LCH98_19415 [Actinobacteria bacterium]|nr:hypothetical protein [Actinomycetota bacterium]